MSEDMDRLEEEIEKLKLTLIHKQAPLKKCCTHTFSDKSSAILAVRSIYGGNQYRRCSICETQVW